MVLAGAVLLSGFASTGAGFSKSGWTSYGVRVTLFTRAWNSSSQRIASADRAFCKQGRVGPKDKVRRDRE